MGRALIKFKPQCAAPTCTEIIEVEFFVLDTPEKFCSLSCAKVYFEQPNSLIRKYRKELR